MKKILFILLITALNLSCGNVLMDAYNERWGGDSTPAGYKETYTADGVSFKMAFVPGGLSFKTQTDDRTTDPASLNSVTNAYWIGETEVTYELWEKVRLWAEHSDRGVNIYTFALPGVQGNDGSGSTTNQHPVTTINWRDSMVWCNALTEWYNANNGTAPNFDIVYYTDENYTTPLQTATVSGSINTNAGSEDKPFIKAATTGNTDMANCTAKGFRLPTLAEWSAAARYKESDSSNGAYEYPASSGKWWTPGSYASGATAAYTDNTATGLVAVYVASSTAVVKSKTTGNNALGLYDMSGNVWEWNFDRHPDDELLRVARGGSWINSGDDMRVGFWGEGYPNTANGNIGFRFSRSAP